MSLATPLLARLRLESSGLARRLARTPLLGPLLRGVALCVLPRGTVVWAKIKSGDAAGLWILLDVRSAGDLRRGDREPLVQQAIRQMLRPGQVFYDIGANSGYFSLLASRVMGNSGRIFAFEAAPDVVSRLRQTLERNSVIGAKVVAAAVWSEGGHVVFERGSDSPDRMVGHVIDGGDEDGSDCIRVPAITLDAFATTAPPPNVLKCDVEGAEVEVFRGAAGLLARHHPAIICEVHSPENLRTLEALLPQLGYRLRRLAPGGEFPLHIVAETVQ